MDRAAEQISLRLERSPSEIHNSRKVLVFDEFQRAFFIEIYRSRHRCSIRVITRSVVTHAQTRRENTEEDRMTMIIRQRRSSGVTAGDAENTICLPDNAGCGMMAVR